MVHHFEVLGIPETKDKAVIRKAFHKLSLVYHPDRPNGNSEKFIEIKTAYEQLVKVDTTKIHDQYEHRRSPYTHFNSATIDKHGDVVIDVSIRHVGVIQAEGDLGIKYHWLTFGMMHATLVVRKADLIKCGYVFTLRFHPVIGRSEAKTFTFTDPRTKWEKFVDRVKSYL